MSVSGGLQGFQQLRQFAAGSAITAVAEEARWCRRRRGARLRRPASRLRRAVWYVVPRAPGAGLGSRARSPFERAEPCPWSFYILGRSDCKMTRWRPGSVVFKVRRVLGGFGLDSVSCFVSTT